MGQSDVLKVLEDADVPLTAREISQLLNDSIVKICKDLEAMERYNEVSSIELDHLLAMRFFKCKRKTKLYYV